MSSVLFFTVATLLGVAYGGTTSDVVTGLPGKPVVLYGGMVGQQVPGYGMGGLQTFGTKEPAKAPYQYYYYRPRLTGMMMKPEGMEEAPLARRGMMTNPVMAMAVPEALPAGRQYSPVTDELAYPGYQYGYNYNIPTTYGYPYYYGTTIGYGYGLPQFVGTGAQPQIVI